MDEKLHFAVDLYQGTAEYDDRYRLPYPEEMTDDLIARAGVSGHGRLLDLACGTGQLAFPLRRSFAEVWAVDREPDFVRRVQAKADDLGAANLRPVVADAETLDADPGHFELAVIGAAFHRLDRDLVAARLLHWLQPGGSVALCWADIPSSGEREWQRVFAALLGRWQTTLGATDRVPANWDEPQRLRPDAQVLSEAGFETAGRREFRIEHRARRPMIVAISPSRMLAFYYSRSQEVAMRPHPSDREWDRDTSLEPLLRAGPVQQLPADSLLFFLSWPGRRRRQRRSRRRDLPRDGGEI